MNILLINHYAGSPDMGMEFRPYYFAREWIKMGHKVSILAADYSHLRRKNPKIQEDFQKENIDGVDYYWIKTGTYEGNGAQRAVTMAQFVGKIIKNAKKITRDLEPDIVICSSTYPLDTFAGQKIRKVSKKPVKLVHEVHDMWPSTLTELGGMSKSNPFVVAMQIGENSAYKNSDAVIAMMKYSKDYMVEHGLKPEKFHHIPLGIVTDDWENSIPIPEQHNDAIRVIKERGQFIVGYFGGHAISNDLDTLLAVAGKMKELEPKVQFVLVGNGVEKPRVMKEAEEKGYDNMHFLPPISKNAIPDLLEKFDCIYISTKKIALYRFGLCLNKMVDSMMSGKPIVSAISAPPTWAEECGASINVESGDVEHLVESILTVMNMEPEQKEAMGESGRKYVMENLDVTKLAKEMLDFINEK